MLAYAINDTHYLLTLAQRMEEELAAVGRLDWFRQSCERAVEQAASDRTREPDEMWRISGSGALRGRAAAVLRELWHWREKEAEAVDRPAFHILQNQELLRAATSFTAGENPDYRHFSARRRGTFRAAAEQALGLAENEWPVPRRRFGMRRSAEANRRLEELRRRRDQAAQELDLEPASLRRERRWNPSPRMRQALLRFWCRGNVSWSELVLPMHRPFSARYVKGLT